MVSDRTGVTVFCKVSGVAEVILLNLFVRVTAGQKLECFAGRMLLPCLPCAGIVVLWSRGFSSAELSRSFSALSHATDVTLQAADENSAGRTIHGDLNKTADSHTFSVFCTHVVTARQSAGRYFHVDK